MLTRAACVFLVLFVPGPAFAAPRGELALTLSGGVTRELGRSDFFVLALLDVPLGRFARQLGRASPIVQSPEPPGSAPPPPSPRRAEPAYVPRLGSALARSVIRLALAAAGFASSPERLDSLRRRAKSSAVLPDVQLRGARGFDHSRRYAPTTTDPYRYSEEGGMDWLLEARLSWKLGRLVFADEEIPVERLRVERASSKQRLVSRVVQALVTWERARLARATAEPDEPERARAELRLLEAEIWLDVLTAGGFSELVHGAAAGSRPGPAAR